MTFNPRIIGGRGPAHPGVPADHSPLPGTPVPNGNGVPLIGVSPNIEYENVLGLAVQLGRMPDFGPALEDVHHLVERRPSDDPYRQALLVRLIETMVTAQAAVRAIIAEDMALEKMTAEERAAHYASKQPPEPESNP